MTPIPRYQSHVLPTSIPPHIYIKALSHPHPLTYLRIHYPQLLHAAR